MKDSDLNTAPAAKASAAGIHTQSPQRHISLKQPVERDAPEEDRWAALTARLARPAGLGTSAARIADQLTRAWAATPEPSLPAADPDPAYAERPWGDGTAPPLYCPRTERINDPLAEEVDARLLTWAKDCGFQGHQLDSIRKATFGRLITLTHADCDDPDRLLLAAQLNAAWWAADDSYADDSESGAVPAKLPPRLALAMAAMDTLPPVGEFTRPLNEKLRADPILVALSSGVDRMARYGTPAQIHRVCYSVFAIFVSWTAYAAWRHTGEYPPAWEYLAARQHDSFYVSMTLVDMVSGYELPANLFYDPRVRRAAIQAGTAAVLVNDLFSVAKDAADEKPVCNMVLQIAADRGCSIKEATEATVNLHNGLVRDFAASHRSLQAVPSLELQRFLRGLRAWMGGGFEWHSTNPRYKTSRNRSGGDLPLAPR